MKRQVVILIFGALILLGSSLIAIGSELNAYVIAGVAILCGTIIGLLLAIWDYLYNG